MTAQIDSGEAELTVQRVCCKIEVLDVTRSTISTIDEVVVIELRAPSRDSDYSRGDV